MLSMTHVKMAKLLGKTLQIPDMKNFLKGMKVPDSGFKPFLIRHTKKNTLYEVKILLDANRSKWIAPEAFSYNMGVISHYVMDYFCKYHENDLIFSKSIAHTFYEVKLELLWSCIYKHKVETVLSKNIIFSDIDAIHDFDPIKFLEEKLRECYILPPSPEKDLDYAFTTAYSICLMEQCKFHFKNHKIKENG